MLSHIDDLLDPALLARSLDDGYVREQAHPTLPLRILNYTEKTQYAREWNQVTRQCRGLIVNAQNQVVARPYAKFFNYSEHAAGTFSPDDSVVVTDKLDGSLGILYPLPDGGHAVATRGSFSSDQAVHATKIWQERYAATATVRPGTTYLFEIIFPANRIVCDYGTLDDLVLLGGVDVASGTPIPAADLPWDGPRVQPFHFKTLAEVLEAPQRPGAEGFVLRFPNRDNIMIKIKQEDYVALHQIVTGLNTRAVWERIGAGDSVGEICEGLPDEFHTWTFDVASALVMRRESILIDAKAEHQRILGELPTGWVRKDYAAHAGPSPLRPWLFMLLDNRDPSAKIWQSLRPEGDHRAAGTSKGGNA